MKNRNIILTAILSLLVCGGLSSTALAQNGNIQPVNVVNTPNVKVVNTTPIPVTGTVTDADNPARHAVQQQLNILAGSNSITIPAGKIFVLETVSFHVEGGSLAILQLNVTGTLITGGTNGQGEVDYFLTIPPANSSGVTASTQALRLYAQPGMTLSVGIAVAAGSGPFTVLTVSLSGYFVSTQ